MKRDRQLEYIFNLLLVMFTVLPSGLCKSSGAGGDPRWNTGVLSKAEVARIMGLLKDINFLLRDRRFSLKAWNLLYFNLIYFNRINSSFYSKNEWISLKINDPIPESAWIKGGNVKMIVHGYAIKGKHSEKCVF